MVTAQNEYLFEPHVRIGPIRFGMTADDVHRIFGPPTRRRPPHEVYGTTRESFREQKLFVDFRRDGRCGAVELYPDARVLFDGTDMMAMSYKNLVRFLLDRGAAVEEDGDGFRCDALGLACYAPQKADPELSDFPVESLFVYERSYHDESDANMKQAPAS